MVSNEEIRHRLRNKREGIGGFLVCDNCGGYYELKSGESPDDFNLGCDCGGNLLTSPTNTLNLSEYEEQKDFSLHITLSYFLILIFWPAAAMGAYYLLSRNNERAIFHGKIITVICLIPFMLIIVCTLFWFIH